MVSVIHLGFDRNPFGVVFTADGTRAYVEQRSEFLDVIDTATNTVVIDALQNLFHDHLAITPDDTQLYVTTPVISSVFVIDTSTNAVVNTIPLSYSPIFPAMTSDGTRVYTVNVQDTVSVIDTATNTGPPQSPVLLVRFGWRSHQSRRAKMIARMGATGSSVRSRSPIRGNALSTLTAMQTEQRADDLKKAAGKIAAAFRFSTNR